MSDTASFELSRREFVILTGSAAAAVSAGHVDRASAQPHSGDAQPHPAAPGMGGDPDVIHRTLPIGDDADVHVWTDTSDRHRLVVAPFAHAPAYVAHDTPTDTPLRIDLASFQLGSGHDRIRATLGDATLQSALAIAASATRASAE